MITVVVGEVILCCDDVVVHTVVPRKELVTEGHVGVGAISRLRSVRTSLASVHDVDEREVGRIGSTDII